MIINKGYIFLYFIAACLLLTPLSTSARSLEVGALARLSYRAYETGSGLDHEKADSFGQSYTVRATKSGNLYNRRGGPYNLALTFNHQRYLTNVNNTKYSPSISLFGGRGNLRLVMPHLNGLNLRIYSNSRSELQRNKSDLDDINWGGFIYDLDLRNEIKEKGFNLKLGVNGGPYYYLYHNNYKILSPEEPDKDYGRLGMSVQYDVNWLHFFRDVESLGGKERRVLSLGNVGLPETIYSLGYNSTYFSQDRFWYRLTNWLDISADFLLMDEKADSGDTSTKKATMAIRGDTGPAYGGGIGLYQRYDSSDVSSSSISLPFWATYKISPSTDVNFTNSYSEEKREDLLTSAITNSKVLADTFTLTSNKRDRFFLETGYSLIKTNTTTRDMEKHSINFEAYTRLKGSFDYGLAYRYDTNKATLSRSSSHSINGSITYRLTQQTRLSLAQGYLSLSNQNKQGAERFNTAFSILHNSPGLTSYVKITRSNAIKDGGGEVMTSAITGRAKKDINKRLNLSISLNYSNEDSDDGTGSDLKSISQASIADITYIVARNFDSKTRLETSKSDISGASSSSYSTLKITEDLKYTYRLKGFSKKKLFDIVGMMEYQESKAGNSQYEQDLFRLGVKYYPTRPFSCGASYSRSSDSALDSKGLHFALRYPLLSLTGGWIGTETSDRYNLNFIKKF